MLKASELQRKLLLTPAQLLRLKWPSEELEELRGQLEQVKRWDSLLKELRESLPKEEVSCDLIERLSSTWQSLPRLELEGRLDSARGLVAALVDRLQSEQPVAFQELLKDAEVRQSLEVLAPGLAPGFAGLSAFFRAVRSGDMPLARQLWDPKVAWEVDEAKKTALHYVAGCKKFDHHCAELVNLMLTKAPLQKSLDGQSFLHAAAARRNCRLLAQALDVDPKLAEHFADEDAQGNSVLSLLGKHVRKEVWTSSEIELKKHHLTEAGEVDLEVQDESGPVTVAVRRSLLDFLGQKKLKRVEASCCRSARVLSEIFAALEHGQLVDLDGRELWQVVSFCVYYGPHDALTDLKLMALNRLLARLKEESVVVPMLLRGGRLCGLEPVQRRHVLRCFLSNSEALSSANHSEKGLERQVKVLKCALNELEALEMPEKSSGPDLARVVRSNGARAVDVPLEGVRMRSQHAQKRSSVACK